MAKTSVKFRDTVAAHNKMVADIGARKYTPIYLLMGEESYFIDSVSDLLCSTILTPEEQAFNQIVLYGGDSDANNVVNYARQMPMMGQRMVIVVKEAQLFKNIDKLAHYTASPIESTILVICHKGKNLDKRSALYKSIVKNGVVLESVRPYDYEIGAWLSNFVQSKGYGISQKALMMITDSLGADIAKISNEMSKLIISMPHDCKQIEDLHIEENIGISKDYNNFELCRAVLNRDMVRSLTIAENFSHNPKANPLLVTIMTLFGQFKQLFTINYLRWLTRQKGEAFPSDGDLMKILKVGNFYAIGELKTASVNWPNPKVFRILGLMREYDGKSKGINTGGATDGELLRELLLKIFAL
ncbi:MAG: DNA polymerase III subunit delta [Rikenellaceae bacterium]